MGREWSTGKSLKSNFRGSFKLSIIGLQTQTERVKGFLLWSVKKFLLKNSLVREKLKNTFWVLRAIDHENKRGIAWPSEEKIIYFPVINAMLGVYILREL